MSDTRTHHQYTHPDVERISTIVAEMRAAELVHVLRDAVAGAPHWRAIATALLARIDCGVPPKRPAQPHTQDEAA